MTARIALVVLLLVGGCNSPAGIHHFTFDASDFNADGHADVAVGAPFDDGGGPALSHQGSVFVYRGPTLSGLVTLNGTEAESRFGFSVAAIGDFNGDAKPDLAVGAYLDDADGNAIDDGTDMGRVFVFLGGALFGSSVIVLGGTEAGGRFGYSVARAGDVNHDGFDDLLVGAPTEDGGGLDRGRAYLYLGASNPSTSPALTFTGGEDLGRFGFSVSTAGDLNQDGFFDWMIGAPGDDNDGNTSSDGWDCGRVFIYRGAHFPDNTVDIVINGDEDFAELGYSVAGLLDVDGDGTGDLVLGAPFDDGDGNNLTAGTSFGRAYFFFGSSINPLTTVDSFSANRIFTGTEADSMFGACVARIGDINSGGAPDLFIGAPMDDGDGNTVDNGLDRGRGFVYFGGPTIDTIADLVFTGVEDGGQLGWSADSGGDVTTDGDRDLIIGAPFDDGDGNVTENLLDRGALLFYRGGPFMDNGADATLSGSGQVGANFGNSGS